MSSSFPPQGQMVLYSSATPPLLDGSYRLTVQTNVAYNAADRTADAPPGPLSQQHYFNVVGPRFSVPASMVAGCFPPRNAHGSFQDDLPHIVLGRRTLPWERALAPAGSIPVTPLGPGDAPALADPYPWVALLLFEEGEYTLLPNIPLQQAVPASVFAALGSPTGITCDAVEADLSLLTSILPSYQELKLLVHVRQVNTDDRELNAYGGDGFFSVAVANRLPSPNAQCRAVLVSLEQRTDLIPQDSVTVAPSPPIQVARPGSRCRARRGGPGRDSHGERSHAIHAVPGAGAHVQSWRYLDHRLSTSGPSASCRADKLAIYLRRPRNVPGADAGTGRCDVGHGGAARPTAADRYRAYADDVAGPSRRRRGRVCIAARWCSTN